MRTAIFVVHREVGSPDLKFGRADEIRALYKHAKAEGIPGAVSCEVWESDRGRIRRRKFDKGVPDASSVEESADVETADQPKRGPGRPRKTLTT